MSWKTRQSTITQIVLANISVKQCQAHSLQLLTPTSIWRKVETQPIPVLQTYLSSFEEPCPAESNTNRSGRYNHRMALGWKEPPGSSTSNPLPPVGPTSRSANSPDCLGLHPSWSGTPPGMGSNCSLLCAKKRRTEKKKKPEQHMQLI